MHQTETPYAFANLPSKPDLVKQFVGKELNGLRTPAMIIDRKVFADNCANMHLKAKEWGTGFRAHVKTHKTVEGARLQMISSADRTNRVVVSTLMEAWSLYLGGLFKDGTVKDLLYGLPVVPNKVEDLSVLWDTVAKDGGTIRILIDHPDQVKVLEDCERKRERPRKWSAFVKIDGGQKRAGVTPGSPTFEKLVKTLLSSSVISIYGFYAHAGNAYASTSLDQATSFLSAEVESVNSAAGFTSKMAESLGVQLDSQPFVLSVGSTPTAHAASAETRAELTSLLHGSLELHAGNYPMLDLQQEHTKMVDRSKVAQRVRVTVASYYPGRGVNGTDEALVDGGAIAFSKDTGPSGTFGEVNGMDWVLGRVSQEHGTLTRGGPVGSDTLALGDVVEIVGQHACLIAAAYPWYYVVDSGVKEGKEIVDIWVPFKGW